MYASRRCISLQKNVGLPCSKPVALLWSWTDPFCPVFDDLAGPDNIEHCEVVAGTVAAAVDDDKIELDLARNRKSRVQILKQKNKIKHSIISHSDRFATGSFHCSCIQKF